MINLNEIKGKVLDLSMNKRNSFSRVNTSFDISKTSFHKFN